MRPLFCAFQVVSLLGFELPTWEGSLVTGNKGIWLFLLARIQGVKWNNYGEGDSRGL